MSPAAAAAEGEPLHTFAPWQERQRHSAPADSSSCHMSASTTEAAVATGTAAATTTTSTTNTTALDSPTTDSESTSPQQTPPAAAGRLIRPTVHRFNSVGLSSTTNNSVSSSTSASPLTPSSSATASHSHSPTPTSQANLTPSEGSPAIAAATSASTMLASPSSTTHQVSASTVQRSRHYYDPDRHIQKRRKATELGAEERWVCPNPGCGKIYRKTSTSSIRIHAESCPHRMPLMMAPNPLLASLGFYNQAMQLQQQQYYAAMQQQMMMAHQQQQQQQMPGGQSSSSPSQAPAPNPPYQMLQRPGMGTPQMAFNPAQMNMPYPQMISPGAGMSYPMMSQGMSGSFMPMQPGQERSLQQQPAGQPGMFYNPGMQPAGMQSPATAAQNPFMHLRAAAAASSAALGSQAPIASDTSSPIDDGKAPK